MVTYLDHYGVKQNWDEEFHVHPAVNLSVGWLTEVNATCALLRPHRAESPDKSEGSCGDLVLVIAAVVKCEPMIKLKE